MEIHTNERPWDLLVIVLMTLLLLLVVAVNPGTLLQTILGLPFLLFIPGYALISALFPEDEPLDHVERLALSFGLSIALTPLTGLLLNYIWEISLAPILISLSTLILALIGLAYLRRLEIPIEERFDINLRIDKPNWSEYDTIDKLLAVGTVILLISSVALAAHIITTPRTGERFTEFYILGPEGMADDYQTSLTVNQSSHLIIGIINREHQDMNYDLGIGLGLHPENMTRTEDMPNDFEFSLTNETYQSTNVIIEHHERWEQHMNISVSEPGSYRLSFFLIVEEEIYRTLHLWIEVSEES